MQRQDPGKSNPVVVCERQVRWLVFQLRVNTSQLGNNETGHMVIQAAQPMPGSALTITLVNTQAKLLYPDIIIRLTHDDLSEMIGYSMQI